MVRKAILFFVILFFLVIAGEIAVRTFADLPPRVYEFDSLTGIRHVPNNTFTRELEGKLYTYKTNSAGFLDKERTLEKPEGVRRIAILGDSITEGAGVEQSFRFTNLLENVRPPRSNINNKLEILNFGVVQTGTVREYLILKNKVLQYNPDVVILVFYVGDDVYDNYRINENSIGILQAGGGFRSLAAKSQLAQFLIKQVRSFDKTSALPSAIRNPLVRFGILIEDTKEVVADSKSIYPGFFVYAKNEDDRFVAGWEKTKEYFIKIRDELAARNVPFFVFVMPSHEQVYPDVWQRIQDETPAMKQVVWDLGKPNKKINTTLSTLGITFFDATSDFKAVAKNSNFDLFYKLDGHLTLAGHQLVTQLFFDKVLKR